MLIGSTAVPRGTDVTCIPTWQCGDRGAIEGGLEAHVGRSAYAEGLASQEPTNPRSASQTTAPTRPETPILRYAFATWCCAVFLEIPSSLPICSFVLPCATRSSTSIS